MHCPKCARENPPQARFCLQCGARLSIVCPQCQTELPPDAQFCLACGAALAVAAPQPSETTAADLLKRLAPKEYVERLLATRGQAHDERRTVTILFADVKGSTAMEERLDPEDVKEVMHGAFEVLISPIYRFEGTLVQLMGDAILAFFGAPIAHEDDPERACRAALEITAEAAEYAEKLEKERGITGFAVRVGINTGLVVVGEVGSDLRVAYTAMGDAINLAARMEQNAAPGTVLITENTHSLIAPLFETQPLGPLQLKGKAEPVPTYRVLAPKAVTGKVRGIAGLQSPLVGRDAECAALSEALACLRSGVGGIVTIVGEAGLGKSRLVAEARKSYPQISQITQIDKGREGICHGEKMPRNDNAPGSVIASEAKQSPPVNAGDCFGREAPRYDALALIQWAEGRCLSYGTSIAYLLWLDVLRNLLGVTIEDSPQQVLDRLHERVQALCGESADRHLPYLARLLSLPLDAETDSRLRDEDGQSIKSNTFGAVDELLRCAANERPLVLVCEDLHWADPTSLELLERVLTLTDRTSLLLICLFRPDPAHGSWELRETIRRSYRHRHTDLELRPLSAADSRTLVGNLLQVEDLPADLRQRIIAAAEGNPFYVEEVIRALIDGGAIGREAATGRWLATRAVADILIPDTLQGVLLARLDRLEEDTKRVLQMAAVIGRVFLYRVLGAIAAEQRDLDAHLLTLQRQEMIRERARLPELEYIFKHELTREAAYNGILKAERQGFHRQVADALERLFPERVEEQLGLLAHHWECAGDAQKATDYLLRAGDQARLAYAYAEAVDYYQRALVFMKNAADPEPAARTWMKLGLTYHSAFDFEHTRQAYDQAFALRQQAERGRQASGLTLPQAPHAYRCAWIGDPPAMLDPAMTDVSADAIVIRHMFSGLLEVTPDLDVQPDVAREWEVLEGGRSYVFHLRHDVHWSDGTPVTAGDFEYAWKRLLSPTVKSPIASLLYDIKNGRAFHQGEVTDAAEVGVSAPDAHTLLVNLEGPTGYFLNLLACTAMFPVPRHAVEMHGQEWARPGRIISNGAFVLQTLRTGKAVILEHNPYYHGRRAGNVERLEFHFLPTCAWAVAQEMYRANELDALTVPQKKQERTRQRFAADYVWERSLSTSIVRFVYNHPPFDDAQVRRAFAMAIDRRKLPTVAWGAVTLATGGFIPPGMPGHAPGIALPYDPEGARRLLAEAGYPHGRGLPVLGLFGLGGRTITDHLQAQWQQELSAELRFDAPQLSYRGFMAGQRLDSLHIILTGWVADHPDPVSFMRDGLAWARGEWRDETYERLLADAQQSMDQAERMKLYRQADKILIQDAIVVPLTYGRQHVLVKPWVKLRLSPLGGVVSKDVVIEPHPKAAGQRTTSVQSAARPAPHAFRRAWIGDAPVTFDPGMTEETRDTVAIQQMFSGLLEVTPDLDLQPDVAKEWEVLEGGRRYVFHLRNDVHWSDGAPVTAGDFEYAWKRVLDPATGSINADLLYDIKNGRAFHQGRVTDAAQVGVSAPDPRTLLVELEGPTSYFLNLLACTATFPVPRHAVEAHGPVWAQPERIISNGVFLLQNLQPGEALILERNPRYHGRREGNVERLEFRSLPASAWSVALEMYEANGLDSLVVPVHEQERMRQRFAADYLWQRHLMTFELQFVENRAPFDDVRVRRAFAMAVERQKLPTVVRGGATPATGGFIPPGMPGHSPGISLPCDPEGARRLLAEAGYPQGHALPVLEFVAPRVRTDVAENLQAQWRQELGAETRLYAPEPFGSAVLERLHTGSLHMWLRGWAADYPDPVSFLSDALVGARRRWRSDAYERLLQDAQRCMDQAKRMGLCRQADEMLMQDAVVLPLSYGRQHLLVKPWVKLHLSPLGHILSKDVIIEPH